MEYYIVSNGTSKGPYAHSQMAQIGLSEDTFVWREGLTRWTPASEIDDLKSFLNVDPPKRDKSIVFVLITIMALLFFTTVGGVCLYVNKKNKIITKLEKRGYHLKGNYDLYELETIQKGRGAILGDLSLFKKMQANEDELPEDKF